MCHVLSALETSVVSEMLHKCPGVYFTLSLSYSALHLSGCKMQQLWSHDCPDAVSDTHVEFGTRNVVHWPLWVKEIFYKVV